MSAALARAQLLMSHGRFEMAEQALGQALGSDPEDPTLHAMLSICLTERKKFDRAIETGQHAVHLGPDDAYCHFALGHALNGAARWPQAETALRQAVALAPWDADYFGALAAILNQQSRWQEALDAADQGLAIEAEHETCTNMRAMALRQLGQHEAARRTVEGALAKSPDNPHSHASLGWTKLHEGEYEPALEHFREALRLDPELEHAREGMLEAMRARYRIYRIVLRYFLWMSRLSSNAQFAIIIGLYLAYRGVRALSEALPGFRPYAQPILIAYIAFAVSTWLAPALFDLLLRTNRFGRHALSVHQYRATNALMAMLLSAAACVVLGFAVDRDAWLIAALVIGLLTIPLVSALRWKARQHRHRSLAAVAVLVVLGGVVVALAFAESARAVPAMQVFALAFLANTFLTGWIVSRPTRDE